MAKVVVGVRRLHSTGSQPQTGTGKVGSQLCMAVALGSSQLHRMSARSKNHSPALTFQAPGAGHGAGQSTERRCVTNCPLAPSHLWLPLLPTPLWTQQAPRRISQAKPGAPELGMEGINEGPRWFSTCCPQPSTLSRCSSLTPPLAQLCLGKHPRSSREQRRLHQFNAQAPSGATAPPPFCPKIPL